MKILVPIDFSECSLAALEVAKKIAQLEKASIVLYHGLSSKDLGFESSSSKTLLKTLEGEVEDRLRSLKEGLATEGFSAVCRLSIGNFIENISQHCINNTYELIVMGSHGASGLQELLIGSKTQKVIRTIHERVLVVKGRGFDLENVLFVSGLNPEDKKPFLNFLQTVKRWDAKRIHLLAIDTAGFFGQPAYLMNELLEEFKGMAGEIVVETHFKSDMSVDAGVRKFAAKHGVGLIGISNHVRHPFKRILRGSNVEAIINHSSVPVLSIDY